MNNTQLNNLVISYQENKCDITFSEIFRKVSETWSQRRVILSLSRKYGLEYDEVVSLANNLVFELASKYRPTGDFYKLLSVALSRKCISLRRDSARYIEDEVSLDASISAEEDSESTLIDFLIHANVEEEAIENLQRESDQRQLIAQLIDKAPDKSRQALKAYVESDFSYTVAAKLLGTKYDTVKRRVEKIANYYDANHNGELYDYFTVATA